MDHAPKKNKRPFQQAQPQEKYTAWNNLRWADKLRHLIRNAATMFDLQNKGKFKNMTDLEKASADGSFPMIQRQFRQHFGRPLPRSFLSLQQFQRRTPAHYAANIYQLAINQDQQLRSAVETMPTPLLDFVMTRLQEDLDPQHFSDMITALTTPVNEFFVASMEDIDHIPSNLQGTRLVLTYMPLRTEYLSQQQWFHRLGQKLLRSESITDLTIEFRFSELDTHVPIPWFLEWVSLLAQIASSGVAIRIIGSISVLTHDLKKMLILKSMGLPPSLILNVSFSDLDHHTLVVNTAQ